MDVCRERSGPPVAAWPAHHGDPWSLCSCSRSLSAPANPSPKEDSRSWKFTSCRWMALAGLPPRYTRSVVFPRQKSLENRRLNLLMSFSTDCFQTSSYGSLSTSFYIQTYKHIPTLAHIFYKYIMHVIHFEISLELLWDLVIVITLKRVWDCIEELQYVFLQM